ncbi:MAG: Nif3-like dinuclear metal center hexameric protein [Ignavibacteriales bacterium]|nr:Nif3-like dinuclear metal center hexameric protein [Ignavibacteriales bacterium]
MKVEHVAEIIESWAPRWIAWERDNVGLQVGDPGWKVSRILVALDVTKEIVAEAISRKADLIVSHHPLFFRPPSNITTANDVGWIVLSLAEKKIAVYAAHTNLDFTRDGVSFALAKKLGLSNIRFLAPIEGLLSKIAVFVPKEHVDKVSEAMARAGAGIIGEYDHCSFRMSGTGTFRGSSKSNPFLGKPGHLETAEEIRLEMIAPRALVQSVVESMKQTHPYDEVAYDVYPLDNPGVDFGSGAIGELPKAQTLVSFLASVKKAIHAESLRVTGNTKLQVKKVAVCGGSGSDLLPAAQRAKADVFITADVRYHTFHSVEGKLALVDAGHWETEHVILEPLAQRLREAARKNKESVNVFVTKLSTNPIQYV